MEGRNTKCGGLVIPPTQNVEGSNTKCGELVIPPIQSVKDNFKMWRPIVTVYPKHII